MHLTVVTETFPPEINGVAMTFGHIARGLAHLGHDVTVCHPERPDLPTLAHPPAYEEHLVRGIPIPGYPTLRLGLPAHRQLRQRWQRRRPDLVHVVTEGPLGASAISVARSLAIPVTSSFHTNFHTYTRDYRVPLLGGLALSWLRRVHNRTARTFAPTRELVNELARLGFRNMGVLSRGIDTEQFTPSARSDELRQSWGAMANSTVVLHVGRVAAEKNYPLLFRAFDAIRAAAPGTTFVVVGDGPLRAGLRRQHRDVVFTGFVPRSELARIYASADVFLHPSLTETFGNVLTEAMASGLAVVAFDYAAARQYVRDHVNGCAVEPADAQAFIAAAVLVATDPALRERIRSAARPSVARQSWARVIREFEGELLEAAGLERPSAAVA